MQPHRWQPTRLPHPRDFPDKSTGMGCHCLLCPNQWAASNCCVFLGLRDLFSGIFGYVCNRAGLVAIISIIIISHLCLPTSLNLCSQLERVKRPSPPIAIATAGLSESKTDYYESSSSFLLQVSSFLPGTWKAVWDFDSETIHTFVFTRAVTSFWTQVLCTPGW